MNRRGFLGALLKGAVAVSLAAKIPAEWIPVRSVREGVRANQGHVIAATWKELVAEDPTDNLFSSSEFPYRD